MISDRSRAGSGGFSIGSVLLLLLIVLKLTGLVGWSWWWVASPLWLGVAFWVLLLGGLSLVAAFLGDRT